MRDGSQLEREPLLAAVPSDANAEAVEVEDAALEAASSIGRVRGALIMISVGILVFLQSGNVSLLTTTQSLIAEDLNAFLEANWFAASYMITASSISPFAGRLSQIFSPRICISFSSVLFALGAVVSGLAPSFEIFLLGRVITGVGGSGIFIVSMVLVLHLTTPKRRGLFIGLVNTGYTAGVAFGAIIAGALAPRFGWRMVFWIQAPLILLCGLCIMLSVPKSLDKVVKTAGQSLATKIARIDYLGVITMTSSIVLLLVGLSSPQIMIWPVVSSVLLGALFLLVEFYIAGDPIIPVVVLKSRGVLLSSLATLGFMMSRWMVLFFTPVYGIAVRNWSPAVSGSLLLPSNGGFAVGGVLVGLFHLKRAGSFYFACIAAAALFSLTFIVLSQLTLPDASVPAYVAVTFLNGLFTGASLNYTLAHVLYLTSPQTHVIVVSLIGTFRGFAGSFGSSIGGGVFARVLMSTLRAGFAERGLYGKEELIRRLVGSPATVASLIGDDKAVAIASYASTLKILFITAGCFAVATTVVQAGTGWTAPEDTKKDTEILNGGSHES